jgi:Flp pilus assembly protein TadG
MSRLSFTVAPLRRRLLALARNENGVAAVEFAMLLPLMITLYIGAVEISQMVSIDRKVSLTTRAVADLVAQSTTLSGADMTNILNASRAVTAPYPNGPMKVTVSSVKIDGAKKATVEWSDTCHGTAYAPNSAAPIATDSPLAIPNSWLIWAEVTYTYTPIFGGEPNDIFYKLTGPKTLSDRIFMRPRVQASVARTGGAATCS